MRKIIRKGGNSLCVNFNKEEVSTYKLSYGDIIEIKIKKIKGE